MVRSESTTLETSSNDNMVNVEHGEDINPKKHQLSPLLMMAIMTATRGRKRTSRQQAIEIPIGIQFDRYYYQPPQPTAALMQLMMMVMTATIRRRKGRKRRRRKRRRRRRRRKGRKSMMILIMIASIPSGKVWDLRMIQMTWKNRKLDRNLNRHLQHRSKKK